jgi:hypothetical protein
MAVALAGEAGLLLELLLLGHTESAWQWTPLLLLVLAAPVTADAMLRPSRTGIQALRVVGGLMLAAGGLGLFLHYRGNVEFEREREAALSGWPLFVEAITGATPALAPGAIAQLGVLLLVAAFRHPVAAWGGDGSAEAGG